MATQRASKSQPPTARGAATRSRIIDAAAELIYVHGVNGTSLDDVIDESGVSKSQLYHYFADKDALVLEVITHQTEHVLNAQEPHLGAIDSLQALKSWRNAVVRLNERASTKGCPLGSLAYELAGDFEEARKRIDAGFEVWRNSIEKGLAKMRERGDLVPAADPHDLSVGILTAAQGGLLLSKTARSSRPLKIALDMAIDYVARYQRVA